MAITHSDIGLSQPAASTTTMKLGTVVVDRNSTSQHQELLTIADPQSSNALARIIDGVPSTEFGLVTRGRVYQSTAADLNATVVFSTTGIVSTTVQVSSVAGTVQVHTLGNSTAADYIPVRIVDSSGTGFLTPSVDYTDGSTVSTLVGTGIAYGNSTTDTMRLVKVDQPLPVQLRTGTLTINSTTKVITSTHSTAVYELVSSAAAPTRHKVFAFHVTSTHTNPSTMVFMSSAQHDLWHVGFGSGSSGLTGANLAISPPAFLFASQANAALNVRIEGGNSTVTSTTVARVSISYTSEA